MVSDAISAREHLIDYLIAKEIDDVGRLSFDKSQLYLKSRLHIQFSKKHAKKMRDAYFLRNVIAHSAGFLRKDQLDFVPEGVDVHSAELRISRGYLSELLDNVEEAVLDFDQRLHANLRRA